MKFILLKFFKIANAVDKTFIEWKTNGTSVTTSSLKQTITYNKYIVITLPATLLKLGNQNVIDGCNCFLLLNKTYNFYKRELFSSQ